MTPIILLSARCNRVKAIKNHFTAYEDFKKKFGEDDWMKGYYMEPDPYDPHKSFVESISLTLKIN